MMSFFFLGDFCFNEEDTERLFRMLNGKIHFIIGNHDKALKKARNVLNMAESVSFYKEIYVKDNEAYADKQFICLSHYPLHEWNKGHHGVWILHGHSHGNDTYDKSKKIINVGIMLNSYKPFSYKQIKECMKNKENINYSK